jgi:hypothetical protein
LADLHVEVVAEKLGFNRLSEGFDHVRMLLRELQRCREGVVILNQSFGAHDTESSHSEN